MVAFAVMVNYYFDFPWHLVCYGAITQILGQSIRLYDNIFTMQQIDWTQ